ncbi:unnamed protein product [Brassica napus]|uniref:(rape) hypothetical protein n=1 Tax=Brassica napus TaxID=3708 RepID=A0A816NS37_BRANA|nr:unnamed protein product [Brassica napus]
MENQEGSENVPRWENMDKDILSNIFKKLDVVDVIMGASRVCITWFLASHNKTIWNTIKLNDLDSIILDNPLSPNLQASGSRYQLRKILTEINKFARTVPNSFFFNVYCSVAEEELVFLMGMKPRDELVQAGTKKLVRFMVCCSDCTICQDVWKHANNPNRYGLEFRYVKEERWKTDEIKELEPDVVTVTTLMNGLWKDGRHGDAQNVFSEMQEKGIFPNLFTYNCMINGFCSSGRWSEAQRLLREMFERKISPDVVTYNALINALVKEGKIVLMLAEHMFYLMATKGCSPNVITFTTLIDGYCGAKRVDDGMELLHEMTETGLVADTITYNTLIHGFCHVGDLNAAQDLLQEMISSGVCPDVVTCNTLLDGLCDNGKLKDALEMFKAMQKSKMDLDASHPFNDVEPYVQTYNILICGLINEGKFLEAEELYEGCHTENRLDEATQMVDSMGSKGFSPDVVTFNTLINGYCTVGRVGDGLELFCEMGRRGIVANAITYRTLIHGFCQVGNINGALDIFQEMI